MQLGHPVQVWMIKAVGCCIDNDSLPLVSNRLEPSWVLSCSQLNSALLHCEVPTPGFSSIPNSPKLQKLKARWHNSCLVASDTFIGSQEAVTTSSGLCCLPRSDRAVGTWPWCHTRQSAVTLCSHCWAVSVWLLAVATDPTNYPVTHTWCCKDHCSGIYCLSFGLV